MLTRPAQTSSESIPAASTYGHPLLRVARKLGKHLATLHRWRTAGVLDAAGVRRRLPMTRVGGRWYVRDEDVSFFFAALAAEEGTSRPDMPSPAARSRAAERAGRELDRLGI